MKPTLRIVTWNCRSGAAAKRLQQLAPCSPDIVFMQECHPLQPLPFEGGACRRKVNASKGIALMTTSSGYTCEKLRLKAGAARAAVAARIGGPVTCNALGIWALAPDYAGDVIRTITAHAGMLRSRPTIVLGDFNSGTALREEREVSRRHRTLIDTFASLGLFSAYHAFHKEEHGHETRATYFHRFRLTEPWHIDFCFVPGGWIPRLTSVTVLDGEGWVRESDHRPLLVELQLT